MAKLKIYNDITSEDEKIWYQWWGQDAVCYKDVEEFTRSIPADDPKIDINLFCNGGDVVEGFAIYDCLRRSGKEISCTIDGKAASMATIIMLAAPKENRRAYQNASILVHNPWLPGWCLGEKLTAKQLANTTEDLQTWQNKMLDVYVERCGCDRDEMQALMDKDIWITTDKAIALGLIGSKLPPISASAKNNIINHINSKKKKEMKNEKKNESEQARKASLFDKVLASLGIKSLEDAQAESGDEAPKSMELNTEDGLTITVEREDGEPQVGDKASPDGTFTMPDGKIITIKDGVITDITDEEDTDESGDDNADEGDGEEAKAKTSPDINALRKQVAALTKERDNLKAALAKAKKQTKSKEDCKVLNAVRMAGGAKKVFAAIASSYVPEGRTPEGKQAAERAGGGAEAIIQAMAENRKRREKRNK